MKRLMVLTVVAGWGIAVCAADGVPQNEINQAIQGLAAQPNYSWTATTKPESNTPVTRQGPTEGKTEQNGYTYFRFTLEGKAVEVARKGSKSAIKTETAWEASEQLTGDRQWIARRLYAFKAPAAEAEDLLKIIKALRSEKGGVYAGDLTAQGVKDLLLSRSRNDMVARIPAGAKGSVRFWVKAGLLVKYEYNLQAKIVLSDHQQEFTVNRTTTVEVKDVGSTKVELPEEAKKKLS